MVGRGGCGGRGGGTAETEGGETAGEGLGMRLGRRGGVGRIEGDNRGIPISHGAGGERR